MKEGIFSRDLALTLSASEKFEFVFRPLENQEMSPIEGSLRNPGPPITPTNNKNLPKNTTFYFQKLFSDIVQILSRLVGTPWRRREVAEITMIAPNGRPDFLMFS